MSKDPIENRIEDTLLRIEALLEDVVVVLNRLLDATKQSEKVSEDG